MPISLRSTPSQSLAAPQPEHDDHGAERQHQLPRGAECLAKRGTGSSRYRHSQRSSRPGHSRSRCRRRTAPPARARRAESGSVSVSRQLCGADSVAVRAAPVGQGDGGTGAAGGGRELGRWGADQEAGGKLPESGKREGVRSQESGVGIARDGILSTSGYLPLRSRWRRSAMRWAVRSSWAGEESLGCW